MAQMRIFVCHSHEDDAFCHALVSDLRRAGADVWYDKHNLGRGEWTRVIRRELANRPVFLVILTKETFASRWVKREMMWAYELADRDPTRIILPITAGPIERIDFSAKNEWLFLHDFKRVEAPRYKPFPQAEAVTRTLHALQLTLPGEAPLPVAPQPTESAGDLVTRGRAMQAQGKHAEALPLFERATELEPRSFDAWFNLGLSHTEAGHHGPDLEAYGRALALDPNDTVAWNNKGNALYGLKRYEEALTAYDRALALDTTYAIAWYNKGNALRYRKRYEEALAAYDRALVLDPNEALGWAGKGAALRALGRAREAEEPERRARVLAWLERVCGEGSLP